MATKIVQDQNIPRIAPSPGVAATSVPIALKSGYLRITIGSTLGSSGGYIAIGTDPIATQDNYHITSYSIDVIKERLARQRIAGITTGTTTIVSFPQNAGNPFRLGEYVTIEGAATAGINTTHKAIISVTDSNVTLDFDSTSVAAPNVDGAILARSVKVSCLSYESETFFNIAEVSQLVSE